MTYTVQAGLFSAVVTAFVIESFTWLQPDSSDTTNQLLLQISSQLASFYISQGFVNATAPMTLQPTAPIPFTPDSNDVKINMLWFLSLTFSLLAAFFAIAAQQWLRSLPLPRHLSVRSSVRLWHTRRNALMAWQVPNIIALLPVLLQVAAVMFLVGQYYLLKSVNHSITVAYAIVSGIPFFLYAISLFAPLLFPSCPFKSPLVPSTIFILNCCMLVFSMLSLFLVIVPTFFFLFVLKLFMILLGKRTAWTYEFGRPLLPILDKVLTYIQFTQGVLFKFLTKEDTFWVDRELVQLSRTSDKEALSEIGAAFSWAPNAVPRQKLGTLWACVKSLPVRERTECVLSWVTLHFGRFHELDFGGRVDFWSPINMDLVNKVNETFAKQYQTYLLEVLPTEWTSCDWMVEVPNVPCIFMLLTQIVRFTSAGAKLRSRLVEILLQASLAQRIEDLTGDESNGELIRFPAVCLFLCSIDNLYTFTAERT
jgi:hypothetical protein